jgi:mannose-6-phosphate isomerase-like protein (cupin superfamily)
MPDTDRAHLSTDDTLRQLPQPPDEPYAEFFHHGTLALGLYAPRGTDPQTPHTRDEVYVVARGQGTFFDGVTRRPFGPGDLLFVAAHAAHRFEDFTDDFAAWVMFYGPEGGEG